MDAQNLARRCSRNTTTIGITPEVCEYVWIHSISNLTQEPMLAKYNDHRNNTEAMNTRCKYTI
jgi:hypothetical protein